MADAGSKPVDTPVLAYWSADQGSITERKLAREFWSPVGDSLGADGIEYVEEVRSSFHLPDGLVPPANKIMPQNSFVLGAVLALSLFVAEGAGQWGVAKVCEHIWEHKLRAPFERLLKRRQQEGYGSTPLTVSLGTWYDKDRIFIGFLGEVRADEDHGRLVALFPTAQLRGLAWLDEHEAAKPVIIYRVENGDLSHEPEQLDSIPHSRPDSD